MSVKQERTNWRDEALSQRHRQWGWNCPGLDLDFVFLEYDKGRAVAVVEYKNENAPPQYASHSSYQALKDLGDSAGLPIFVCRYASDFSWWNVVPLNQAAKSKLPTRTRMSEREWVQVLYGLRGYECPASLFEDMNVVV